MGKKLFLLTLLLSIVFTFLFYQSSASGINLIIFELMILASALILNKKNCFKNNYSILFLSLLAVSIFSVIFTHTAFAIAINILIFIETIALLVFFETSKIHALWLHMVPNAILGPISIFSSFSKNKNKKRNSFLLITLSIFIILFFIILYSAANQYFANIVSISFSKIKDFFSFDHIDVFLLIILGFIISAALLTKTNIDSELIKNDGTLLIRTRKKRLWKNSYLSFMKWYRASVFLLFALNILILIFNIVDIIHVWLFFKWEGQFLREFVHQGTWVLSFSILVSALIAIIIFNGNIHFYSKNKFLKILINIWLFQNLFMAMSVLVRNLRYINYYNLATLRIGVFIFLAIVIFGIIALLIKINKGKNLFWLIRKIFVFSSILLVFSAAINWNRVIAKYNIKHRNDAYFHKEYMVMLPEQTLDIIYKNKELFNDEIDTTYYPIFITREFSLDEVSNYSEIIDKRIERFKNSMSNKNWREWNYADWRTFQRLKEIE